MKDKKMSNYIIFWLSQAVSQLGSSMTSYALIIWSYKQTHSAMSVSIMTFCSYLPYVLISIFAGSFVDKHTKKRILIISDTIAACCSVCVFVLLSFNALEIWHIYIVNATVGFMNAFQSPATSVAIGIMVPKNMALNECGILYCSFKYGDFEGVRNGRYFIDMTAEKMDRLVGVIGTLEVKEQMITTDVRPGRDEEKWLNVILRKR